MCFTAQDHVRILRHHVQVIQVIQAVHEAPVVHAVAHVVALHQKVDHHHRVVHTNLVAEVKVVVEVAVGAELHRKNQIARVRIILIDLAAVAHNPIAQKVAHHIQTVQEALHTNPAAVVVVLQLNRILLAKNGNDKF